MCHNKRHPLSPRWLWRCRLLLLLPVSAQLQIWRCSRRERAAIHETLLLLLLLLLLPSFSCQRTTTTKKKTSWRHKCGRSCICFSLFTAFCLPWRTLGISLWSPLPTLINISTAACLPHCYCSTHTHLMIRCINEHLQQLLQLCKKKSSDAARLPRCFVPKNIGKRKKLSLSVGARLSHIGWCQGAFFFPSVYKDFPVTDSVRRRQDNRARYRLRGCEKEWDMCERQVWESENISARRHERGRVEKAGRQ